MNYQVGDLLMTTGNGKHLCVITEIKGDDSYYVMSLETYCTFCYSKANIYSNRLFQKVA